MDFEMSNWCLRKPQGQHGFDTLIDITGSHLFLQAEVRELLLLVDQNQFEKL